MQEGQNKQEQDNQQEQNNQQEERKSRVTSGCGRVGAQLR